MKQDTLVVTAPVPPSPRSSGLPPTPALELQPVVAATWPRPLALQAANQAAPVRGAMAQQDPALSIRNFSAFYGKKQALYDVTMNIPKGKITAMIGPSGCGKSTLLRSLNRLNDLIPSVRTQGEIHYRDQNILGRDVDVTSLRKHIGMVFQKSNPFPKSVFENVVYALRVSGVRNRQVLRETCEKSLRAAALWDEVHDNLKGSALSLSGGQQQRLCIARALAAEPEILLMDEPCSALDPIATSKIEELIRQLAGRYTIVIVTHNMQQAARASDFCAFMYLGRLIEFGPTLELFTAPRLQKTQDYITGRFG